MRLVLPCSFALFVVAIGCGDSSPPTVSSSGPATVAPPHEAPPDDGDQGSTGGGDVTTFEEDAGFVGDGATRDASQAPMEPVYGCDNPPPPPIDPALLPVCPQCAGDARCVPRSFLDSAAPETVERLGACDDTSACVPDAIIRSGGFYRATTCGSLNGNEGRCLSECLPEVATQRDVLPQDVCAATERCVPCFDPRTGEATGACGIACDEGPVDDTPHLFPTCCDDLGMCLPRALVPMRDQALLPRDECDDPEALCAPTALMDEAARPATCRSIGDAEGRCLAACLPALDGRRELLPRASCLEGELCVPCFDPRDGTATGACSVHGDAPTEPPLRFETACCGNGGRCIPDALAGDSAGDLPVDRCDTEQGDGWVCAPRRVVEDETNADNPFANCRVRAAFVTVARGKCVPRCMIDDDRWITRALGRANCESGELCIPCAVARGLPGC